MSPTEPELELELEQQGENSSVAPAPNQAPTSAPSTAAPPPAPAHRAIYSYWSTPNSSSSSTSTAQIPAPVPASTPAGVLQKRKRKKEKAEGGQAQARLSLGARGEEGKAGWGIERVTPHEKRGRGKTKVGEDEGEEGVKEKGKGKRGRKSAIGRGGEDKYGSLTAENRENDDMIDPALTALEDERMASSSDQNTDTESTNARTSLQAAAAAVASTRGIRGTRGQGRDLGRKSQLGSRTNGNGDGNSSSFDHPSADHPSDIVPSTVNVLTRPRPSLPTEIDVQASSSSPPQAIESNDGESFAGAGTGRGRGRGSGRGRVRGRGRGQRRSSDIEITSCNLLPGSQGSRALSRTASKGLAVDDAIDVDVVEAVGVGIGAGPSPSKAAPKKIVFAADNKPTHSFFSRLSTTNGLGGTAGSASDAASAGRSRASSIVSEVPTLLSAAGMTTTEGEKERPKEKEKRARSRTRSRSPEKKKVHSFFRSGGGGGTVPGKLKDGWGGSAKDGEEWMASAPAPWPRGDWIGLDQRSTISDEAGPSVPRRPEWRSTQQYRAVEDDAFWTNLLRVSTDRRDADSSRFAARPLQAISTPTSTPSDFTRHPALSAIPAKAEGRRSNANRDAWTERYRPVRAAEVLGNEVESTYLQEWLSALAVGHHATAPSSGGGGTCTGSGSTKLPKVVRKVRRAKKSALLDGWIVDDLGLYGTEVDNPSSGETEEEAELQELEEPYVHHDPSYRPTPPRLEERLTNTILLTGPNGSGKTAAVHAAATELGWDVFEVYPGVGRRTGGNLMALVGDVGRNHILAQGKDKDENMIKAKGRDEEMRANGNGNGNKRQRGEAPKDKEALKSFFGKSLVKKRTNIELGSQGSAAEPIDIDVDDDEKETDRPDDPHEIIPIQSDVNESLTATATAAPLVLDNHVPISNNGHNGNDGNDGCHRENVRQSLILIDEADILFEEESTFWAAVVALIAESRRPVVLTCNDHLRIPRDQLPLQAILQFRPPPSSLTKEYLKTIACAEGPDLRQNLSSLDQLIEHVGEIATLGKEMVLHQPLPPNGHEAIPYLDLRKAITQLQLDLHGTRTCASIEPDLDWDAGVHGVKTENDDGGGVDADADLEHLARRLDLTSYADAHVDLLLSAQIQLLDIDRYTPTADDQLSIRALVKSPMRDDYPLLASVDRSGDIAAELLGLVGGALPAVGDLHVARTSYIRSTLPILDPLIPLSAPLLPHSSLFLHTLPTITSIVRADDVLQSAEEEAVLRGEGRVDRKTGRAVRGFRGYKRWFDLDGDGLGLGMARVVGRGLRV